MKILIVEDDGKVARLLQRVLSEEGYATDICSSGDDALVQGRSGLYDLILLDWMLGGADGLHVCRELRSAGLSVPMMMLTARGEVAERVTALNSGVDDYLVKPFEIDELLARVAALLRRASRQHLVSVGRLELDRAAHKAKLAGRTLDLSTKEFDLLAHLAAHVDQLVTRSSLLFEVWGVQLNPQSNLIDVHISRLRDKLEGHAWMIETVRGRGYRLRSVPGE